MTTVLAFDIYGTLIDTSGVISSLERLAGDKATDLSALWRNKQLEYSFRRGLMQNYRDFSVCTSQALDYACEALDTGLSADDRELLLASYRVLPAYPEVKEALAGLKKAGFRIFAFSNGKADDLNSLLTHAGIENLFEDIVSCDEVKSFKPNPGVYAHFLRRAHASRDISWLISSNTFDVLGALSSGMQAAWVKRSPRSVFDPWELKPTAIVSCLTELTQALYGTNR